MKWTYEDIDYLIELREIDELNWRDISEKLNRSETACKKKYEDIYTKGIDIKRKKVTIPRYVLTLEGKKEFEIDYVIDKMNGDDIIKKYGFESKYALQKYVKKFNFRQRKKRQK